MKLLSIVSAAVLLSASLAQAQVDYNPYSARDLMDDSDLFEAREYDLYDTRDFEEDFEARDYDEDFEARDYEEDFEARDYEEDFEARDYDEELDARDIDDYEYLQVREEDLLDARAMFIESLSTRELADELEARLEEMKAEEAKPATAATTPKKTSKHKKLTRTQRKAALKKKLAGMTPAERKTFLAKYKAKKADRQRTQLKALKAKAKAGGKLTEAEQSKLEKLKAKKAAKKSTDKTTDKKTDKKTTDKEKTEKEKTADKTAPKKHSQINKEKAAAGSASPSPAAKKEEKKTEKKAEKKEEKKPAVKA